VRNASFQSVYCPVSRKRVPCERDFEGRQVRVLCGDLDAASGLCRRQTQAHASGWLGEFLERAHEKALGVRGARCRLVDVPARAELPRQAAS
jgi:hypothetical protein